MNARMPIFAGLLSVTLFVGYVHAITITSSAEAQVNLTANSTNSSATDTNSPYAIAKPPAAEFHNPSFNVSAEGVAQAEVYQNFDGSGGILLESYAHAQGAFGVVPALAGVEMHATVSFIDVPSPIYTVQFAVSPTFSGSLNGSSLSGVRSGSVVLGGSALTFQDGYAVINFSSTPIGRSENGSVFWSFTGTPGATPQSPYGTIKDRIDSIQGGIDNFINSFLPGQGSQGGSAGGVRGLWDPNLVNGSGATTVGYIHYIFDSAADASLQSIAANVQPLAAPAVPHDVTLHYTTDLNSFSKFVVPTGLASGDTEFLATFNGFVVPVTAGQTLDFLSFVPGGVQGFELQHIDLGGFGTPANPMDFTGGVQFVDPGATGLVMFVVPEPSSVLLACIAFAAVFIFRIRRRK